MEKDKKGNVGHRKDNYISVAVSTWKGSEIGKAGTLGSARSHTIHFRVTSKLQTFKKRRGPAKISFPEGDTGFA